MMMVLTVDRLSCFRNENDVDYVCSVRREKMGTFGKFRRVALHNQTTVLMLMMMMMMMRLKSPGELRREWAESTLTDPLFEASPKQSINQPIWQSLQILRVCVL